MVPEGTLLPLHRADGSASYSSNGYSVLAAVNGPVDVQRRDELPEEAVVDVIVRPAAGVGGQYIAQFPTTMVRPSRCALRIQRCTGAPFRNHYSENPPSCHTRGLASTQINTNNLASYRNSRERVKIGATKSSIFSMHKYSR